MSILDLIDQAAELYRDQHVHPERHPGAVYENHWVEMTLVIASISHKEDGTEDMP